MAITNYKKKLQIIHENGITITAFIWLSPSVFLETVYKLSIILLNYNNNK